MRGVRVWPRVGVYYTLQTAVCHKAHCVLVCVCLNPRTHRLFPCSAPKTHPPPLLSLRRGAGEPPLCSGGLPSTSPPCPAVTTSQRAQTLLHLKAQAQSSGSRAGRGLKPPWLPSVCCEVGDPGQEAGWAPRTPGSRAGSWCRAWGPAAAKAPAGAGEESGRLDAGSTGRNWHWAHGPACGGQVRGCPVSGG